MSQKKEKLRGCTSENNLLADDARSTDSAWSDSEFEDDDVEESKHNDQAMEAVGNSYHGNTVTEEHQEQHHEQPVENEQETTLVEEDEVSPRTQVICDLILFSLFFFIVVLNYIRQTLQPGGIFYSCTLINIQRRSSNFHGLIFKTKRILGSKLGELPVRMFGYLLHFMLLF